MRGWLITIGYAFAIAVVLAAYDIAYIEARIHRVIPTRGYPYYPTDVWYAVALPQAIICLGLIIGAAYIATKLKIEDGDRTFFALLLPPIFLWCLSQLLFET
jgi:hypothetical protein